MENSFNKIVEEILMQEKARIEKEWKLTQTRMEENFRLEWLRMQDKLQLMQEKARIEKEWKLTQTRMEENFRLEWLRMQDKLKLAETSIWTEINKRGILNLNDRNRTSAGRSMKLQFINKISQPVLTGKEIKGEGNTCIKVALIDNSSGNIVDVGPEASAIVEIVVLKKEFDACERDDWTVEEFNDKIVYEVEGKMHLLAGNVNVKLQGGTAVLRKVKFKQHAIKMKPPEFQLGARIADLSVGIFVKEAKTESFVVKDFRSIYSMKHKIPSLLDKVWRLRNIRKGGNPHKRLQGEGISTVEEFLIRLLKDPEGLKNIVGLVAKKWEVAVNHARACPSDKRMYCYRNSQQKTGMVFDIHGNVIGLYSESQYAATNMLSENNKADAGKLLSSAIEHWNDIIPFDDENSAKQYFTSIKTSVHHSDSPGSGYPGYEHYNTGATPSISNSSFQGINSNMMNSTRETGLKDLDQPFSIDDVEIDDSHLELSPDSNLNIVTILQDIDRGFSFQCKDFNDETNAGSGTMLFEPDQAVIPICKPKRWKTLFCVSRFFSIRKMAASSEGYQARKKQKIC